MKEVPFLLEIVIKNKLSVKNWNQISKPQLYIDGFFAYSVGFQFGKNGFLDY